MKWFENKKLWVKGTWRGTIAVKNKKSGLVKTFKWGSWLVVDESLAIDFKEMK